MGDTVRDENWLKWGVMAAAGLGALLLIAFAFAADDDLNGTSWSADQLVLDGTNVDLIEGTTITATFEDDGVAGIASCNNYFGSYTTDGDTIAFGPMGTTLMACTAEIAGQEGVYLAALGTANRFAIDGDTLTLFDGDTELVRYQRVVGALP